MMEARECFPLGRGPAAAEPRTDAPTVHRPFGMCCAEPIAPTRQTDDTAGLVYDSASQTLRLAVSTGDPATDHLIVAAKTATTRATDRDGQRPTTPKDLDTDKD